MAIVNSVTSNVGPKLRNSWDVVLNAYLMEVVDAAKGCPRKAFSRVGKVLPTHPKMKGAEVSEKAWDSFLREAERTSNPYPYGITKDGVPIVSIFKGTNTGLDARCRAVLLKETEAPAYRPARASQSPCTPRDVYYAYAYAK